jgi:ligand-binding sensor domain-containing protein
MSIFHNKTTFYYCKRKVYLYLLFSIILFSYQKHSNAQDQSLRFEHIGMEEGLSNDIVTAMLQDSKGYMWFGTLDGLNRYDGYSFVKYQFDPFDSNSVSQNFIYTIFEDKSGSIWVSSFEGLCKFDRSTEKFTRYKPLSNARFSDPNISSINEDNEGMIWVGSWSGGLCRFDPRTGKFLPENFDLEYHKLPGSEAGLHDATSCIYKDRNGTLWVTNQTGLHNVILTPAKDKPAKVNITHYMHNPKDLNSLSSNNASSVMEDKAGIIWVTTSNGLNSFNRKTGIFKHYPHDPKNRNSISSNYSLGLGGKVMQEDGNGNLWIATDNGLNKLDKGRNYFTAYFHKPNDAHSLGSNNIISLLIDQDNVLWGGIL